MVRYRGYVPHIEAGAVVQFVTWRLADSMANEVLARWREELKLDNGQPEDEDRQRYRDRVEKYLDLGHGSCLLADQRAAQIVQDALLHFDKTRYRLLAWAIMPNHVHVVVELVPEWPLAKVVHSWKSFTANAINRLLGREGAVWFRDYYDRFIRTEAHLAAAVHYTHANPVKAGLVTTAEEWRFSSAGPAGSRRTQEEA